MRPREGKFVRVHRGGYVALSVELYSALGCPEYLGWQLNGSELELWPARWDSKGRVKVLQGKREGHIRQFHSRRLGRRVLPGRYPVVDIDDWAVISLRR